MKVNYMNLEELSKEELILKLQTSEERYTKVKERAKKFLQENQTTRLFHSCKANAKKKGVLFSLSVNDILIPERCVYLGVKLTNTPNQGRVATNASVDRKTPAVGYTSDNIQIISDLANRMKSNATEDELIAFAKGVLKIHAGIDVDKIIAQIEQL